MPWADQSAIADCAFFKWGSGMGALRLKRSDACFAMDQKNFGFAGFYDSLRTERQVALFQYFKLGHPCSS
jgi:hypothetical protein